MSDYDIETFYNPEKCAIILPISPIKQLPQTVRHEDEIFYRVPRLVATVCSLTQIVGLERPSKHRTNVLQKIARQLAFNTVTFGGFTNELSLCQKDAGKTKSIISGAEVLGLSEWVQGVRSDTSIRMPMPYPYVTLYTKGSKQGVPIHGRTGLTEHCQSIQLPELASVLHASK